MQFRESCDATCIDENIVIDEGNENMINNEATDEEGYVNDTEVVIQVSEIHLKKNLLMHQWVILVRLDTIEVPIRK